MATCVLFDLDGTIVDTEAVAAETLQTIFKNHGFRLSQEEALSCFGKKWDTAFAYLKNRYPIEKKEGLLLKEALDLYRNKITSHLTTIPGAVEKIRDLHGKIKLGLVSGSLKADIEHVLTVLKIRNCFELVLGAEDYKESKPSPEGYLLALKKLKCESSQTLVFEDSPAGMTSAKKAGCYVVAITSTHRYWNGKVDVSSAHTQFEDFTKIPTEWILKISNWAAS